VGGSAGTGGAGGHAGSAGTGGSGGRAGAGGTGGSSGAAGAGGTGGPAGSSGTGGTGGSAGTAGTSGAGGNGTGGAGGTAGNGGADGTAGTGGTGGCSDTNIPRPPTDVDYRAVIQPNIGDLFLAPGANWTVTYQFTVPPLPCSSTWNHLNRTIYVYGDVSFDHYGQTGGHPIAGAQNYAINQIVPEIAIGDATYGGDANFHPVGQALGTWSMEAQYFWQGADGTRYVEAGPPIGVDPGVTVTSTIAYDATTGHIIASIAIAGATSSLDIARPFPDNPSLFSDWKDFLTQAAAASGGNAIVRSRGDVETHWIDEATACSLLPLAVSQISLPGIGVAASNYVVSPFNGLVCPTNLAVLSF
jgi:hypothetical protein